MNIDEVGEYLEHQGLTDDEIDGVLEHFGVKGQKWGVRRQKNKNRIPSKSERKKDFFNATKKNAKLERRVATGAAFIISRGLAKSVGLKGGQAAAATLAGTAVVNSLMRVEGAKRLSQFQG